MAQVRHTRDENCPRCSGGYCDQGLYGTRWLRFVLVPWHREAYLAAFYAPDHRSSRNELERLSREFATLPARHSCWCRCPREDPSRGYPACHECLILRRDQKPQEAVEIGRGSHVNPPMPSTLLLDLSMAMQALGVESSSGRIADYLNHGRDVIAEPEPIIVPDPVVIPSNGHVVVPELPHTNGHTNGHAVLNDHADLAEMPAACACMGYRLGGAAFCSHLAMTTDPQNGATSLLTTPSATALPRLLER